jgi:hypothetical protein
VSVAAFGAAAAAFTILAYLGARTRDLFRRREPALPVGYLFLGKWVQEALYYLPSPVPVRRGEPVDALLIQAPLDALYSAIAGVVAVGIYRALRR